MNQIHMKMQVPRMYVLVRSERFFGTRPKPCTENKDPLTPSKISSSRFRDWPKTGQRINRYQGNASDKRLDTQV